MNRLLRVSDRSVYRDEWKEYSIIPSPLASPAATPYKSYRSCHLCKNTSI